MNDSRTTLRFPPLFALACGLIAVIACGGCEQVKTSVVTSTDTNELPADLEDLQLDHSSLPEIDSLPEIGSFPQEEPDSVESKPPASTETQEASKPKPPAGILNRASDLLGKASEGTSNAGRWVQDQLGAAADTTGSAAQGSVEWANETFRYLKDRGMTSANSTSEWLSSDWKNMESWEYKIVPIGAMSDQKLENTLNERGSEGWECFSIDASRMILKKRKESYLRRLPFRDLIKLAPLLNQSGEN